MTTLGTVNAARIARERKTDLIALRFCVICGNSFTLQTVAKGHIVSSCAHVHFADTFLPDLNERLVLMTPERQSEIVRWLAAEVGPGTDAHWWVLANGFESLMQDIGECLPMDSGECRVPVSPSSEQGGAPCDRLHHG